MAPSKPAFLSPLLTGLDKSSSYNYILDFILGLPVSFPALIIPVNINQLIYQMEYPVIPPEEAVS